MEEAVALSPARRRLPAAARRHLSEERPLRIGPRHLRRRAEPRSRQRPRRPQFGADPDRARPPAGRRPPARRAAEQRAGRRCRPRLCARRPSRPGDRDARGRRAPRRPRLPRIRQNLALAYAIAGDWRRARAIAAQDLSAGRARPAPAAMGGLRPARFRRRPRSPACSACRRPRIRASRSASRSRRPPTTPRSPSPRRPSAPKRRTPRSRRPRRSIPKSPTPQPAPVRAGAGAGPDRRRGARRGAAGLGADRSGLSAPRRRPAARRGRAGGRAGARSAGARARSRAGPGPICRRRPLARRAAGAADPRRGRRAAHAAARLPPRRAAGRARLGQPVVVQLGAFSNEGNAERAWVAAERDYGLDDYRPLTTTFSIEGPHPAPRLGLGLRLDRRRPAPVRRDPRPRRRLLRPRPGRRRLDPLGGALRRSAPARRLTFQASDPRVPSGGRLAGQGQPPFPCLAPPRRGSAGRGRPCAPRRPSRPARGSPSARDRRPASPSISTPRFIGPGCMTIAFGAARVQPRAGQAVARVIIARACRELLLHPLALDAQHHHHVGARDALVHVGEERQVRASSGSRVGGPTSRTSAPSKGSARRFEPATRLCTNVAADRDLEPFDPAEPPPDGRARRARPGSDARRCRRRR